MSDTETCERAGVRASLDAVKRLCDGVRPGSFIFVRGYESEDGALASYSLQYGVDYYGARERFANRMRRILGGSEHIRISAHYRTWVSKGDKTGAEHVKELEGSDRKRVTKTLILDDKDQRVREALLSLVLKYGRSRPWRRDKPSKFSKKANGLYMNEKTCELCIRMALLVGKRLERGMEKEHCSKQETAIRNAIKRELGFDRWRSFKFSRVSSLTMDGQAVLEDRGRLYFALPEYLKCVGKMQEVKA